MHLVSILALAAMPVPATPAENASAVFDSLKGLVGEWEGTNARGRTVKVNFRLTAADTVLVESWDMGNGRSSMTLYHRDKADLMATHYCPLGNQPRLVLTDGPPDRLAFTFKDATNLHAASDEHEHSFWLAFDGPDSFMRSETYVNGDGPATSEIMFKRVHTSN